jgi:hypothetical protein
MRPPRWFVLGRTRIKQSLVFQTEVVNNFMAMDTMKPWIQRVGASGRSFVLWIPATAMRQILQYPITFLPQTIVALQHITHLQLVVV